ncbi:MAG: twin-arginine translocase TatA/TatE family subunit [Ignavibacteriaceae bacterium]|jgi:sec-independent protein translocase protein TatA
MFGNIGMTEILIIFLIILVFFGAKKIPDIAQGMGKGIREFKKAVKDVSDDGKKEDSDKNNDKKE